MVIEVLVAGSIGIIGTLLGAFLTYYFGQRREESTRKIDAWNKVVQDVYSPLIFDLRTIKDYGTLQQLRVLNKTIPELLKKQNKEQLDLNLAVLLKITNRSQNQVLKNILRRNVQFIKPTNLWDDLFQFQDSLELIEYNFAMFSTGLFVGNPKFVAHLKAYAQVGAILDDAAEHLVAAMSELASMDKPPTSVNYKTFFTEDVRRRLVSELDKAPDFAPSN
jgi:hypothetical protein